MKPHLLFAASATALLLAACGDPAPEQAPAEDAAAEEAAETGMSGGDAGTNAGMEGGTAPADTGSEDTETEGGEVSGDDGPYDFSGAWIRTPPGGRDVTAGYVTIAGPEGDVFTAAASSAVEVIEFHTMEDDGEVMRMRQVMSYELGADPLTLEPGSDHLMLFGAGDLSEGDVVEIEFLVEGGGVVRHAFPVMSSAPEMDVADDVAAAMETAGREDERPEDAQSGSDGDPQ